MKKYQKNNIYIDDEAVVDKTVKIYPNVSIVGKCMIKSGVIIKSNSIIENSSIGENTEISSSIIEKSEILSNVKIGPFAHIRPNSVIGNNCKIGNFVEVKNSTLKDNVKASHLAYIGDCEIGNNCNIGCGVIFANFDGRLKHKTIVKENCFIGSNSNIIAPVVIEKNTYICAGTTLTKNTNEGDFIIARARETVKPQQAKKYLRGEK